MIANYRNSTCRNLMKENPPPRTPCKQPLQTPFCLGSCLDHLKVAASALPW
ncbi:MAG: hypothetical protein RR304_02175 [Bacteroides sp.]